MTGEEAGVGKNYLWDNERGKLLDSAEAVQAHKNDKSHCKLFTYGDATLEFPEGCDFRSSSTDHREGGG